MRNSLKQLFITTLLALVITITACVVPQWVSTVEADAKIAAPIAASLIDIIDPALAPVVTLIETGFNALAKTLDDYKAQPTVTNLQAVQAAFQAVDENVAQLENAAQIKNVQTQTTITEVVQLLNQCVLEISAMVPPSTAATMKLHTRARGISKGWTSKDIKKQYNLIIKGDPQFKALK